jgi:hypothetical protein
MSGATEGVGGVAGDWAFMDGGAGNQEWFYILAGQWRSRKSDPIGESEITQMGRKLEIRVRPRNRSGIP